MIYEAGEDSFLLRKYVKELVGEGEKVLELGAGSGILAEAAAENKAEVTASDIDDEAVEFLKKKKINAVKSNLFENIKGRFDWIIFNPPYLPLDEREELESRKATTGGKKGSEILERALENAREYLNKNGKILIVVSSLTGNVEKLFKKFKFKFKKLEEKKEFFEKLIVYLVF